jgi:imidazolonepropionase-like amidohydrolase
LDLKLEALVPVARGQMPVVINANAERDIKNAIAFAGEMKLKAIISGGAEAYKVADLLKAKNIPVIVGPVLRLPSKDDDPYDAAFANAGLLWKAGVKIAFQTRDSSNVRNLPYNEGMAGENCNFDLYRWRSPRDTNSDQARFHQRSRHSAHQQAHGIVREVQGPAVIREA